MLSEEMEHSRREEPRDDASDKVKCFNTLLLPPFLGRLNILK